MLISSSNHHFLHRTKISILLGLLITLHKSLRHHHHHHRHKDNPHIKSPLTLMAKTLSRQVGQQREGIGHMKRKFDW